MVGHNSGTHPLFFSRHLTLQNYRNMNFLDFSIFDALMHAWWFMAHGSRLTAHGQGRPGEAHGQRPARPRGPRSRPQVRVRPLAMSHEPPLASLGHEPWALRHEPWAMNHQACIIGIEYWEIKRKLKFLRFCKVRCRDNKGGWVLELFPTIPTYQNPINIRQLLCKVS